MELGIDGVRILKNIKRKQKKGQKMVNILSMTQS